jgi:hypothetical protein
MISEAHFLKMVKHSDHPLQKERKMESLILEYNTEWKEYGYILSDYQYDNYIVYLCYKGNPNEIAGILQEWENSGNGSREVECVYYPDTKTFVFI